MKNVKHNPEMLNNKKIYFNINSEKLFELWNGGTATNYWLKFKCQTYKIVYTHLYLIGLVFSIDFWNKRLIF